MFNINRSILRNFFVTLNAAVENHLHTVSASVFTCSCTRAERWAPSSVCWRRSWCCGWVSPGQSCHAVSTSASPTTEESARQRRQVWPTHPGAVALGQLGGVAGNQLVLLILPAVAVSTAHTHKHMHRWEISNWTDWKCNLVFELCWRINCKQLDYDIRSFSIFWPTKKGNLYEKIMWNNKTLIEVLVQSCLPLRSTSP